MVPVAAPGEVQTITVHGPPVQVRLYENLLPPPALPVRYRSPVYGRLALCETSSKGCTEPPPALALSPSSPVPTEIDEPPASLVEDASTAIIDVSLTSAHTTSLSLSPSAPAHPQTPDRNIRFPAPPTLKTEIDILEAGKDKDNPAGQAVSQSARLVPYINDCLYSNGAMDRRGVNNPAISRLNSYHGSVVYVSSLLSPSPFHV